LDIGTAKVTEEEAEGIPHHLLDIVPIDQDYTASDFKRDARQAIESIIAKGKLPIVVGGSGLYIEGLLFDMQFGGEAAEDPHYRKQLEAELERTDAMNIWKQLQEQDP
jgi:tRNA dimethylallyltransferase